MTHNEKEIERLIDEEIEEERQKIDNPPHPMTEAELMEHYRKKGRLADLRARFERVNR